MSGGCNYLGEYKTINKLFIFVIKIVLWVTLKSPRSTKLEKYKGSMENKLLHVQLVGDKGCTVVCIEHSYIHYKRFLSDNSETTLNEF